MPRPLTIALTGGIGSGKSTVARLFEVLGVPIIDSDLIARDIVEPGKPALQQIVQVFGEEVLTAERELDRKQLSRIVFNHPEKKQQLEAILHPAIYDEIDERINSLNSVYCIVVIPLLLETGAAKRYDRVLVVDVPEETQVTRTMQRDAQQEHFVKKVMNTQISREERLRHADDVIANDVTIDELSERVLALDEQYRAFA